MVEIALSLAVVAFALVAILGVLPTGMTVQKENREDTLINQEGRYWIEAIRTGARGLHDLTNYVESIEIFPSPGKALQLTNLVADPLTPSDLISLLSVPKYVPPVDPLVTNRVVARVKAITGNAAEKGPLTNDVSFRYQLQAEITDEIPIPPELAFAKSNGNFVNEDMALLNLSTLHRLHNVRLVLRWPVTQRGNTWAVGNNKKTFRAKIAGTWKGSTNNISKVVINAGYTNTISPNDFVVDSSLSTL
jgi:hypothetical protein